MLVICSSNQITEDTLRVLDEISDWRKFYNIYTVLKIEIEDVNNFKSIVNENKDRFNFIYIDVTDFDKIPEENQVDFVLDIAESGVNIHAVNTDKSLKFPELVDNFEVKTVVNEKDYIEEVDMLNLDESDVGIIQEIFEVDLNQGFDLKDFWTSLFIKESEITIKDTFNEGFTIRLEDIDYKHLLERIQEIHSAYELYLMKSYYSYPFNFKIYTPLFQVKRGDEDKILEYKWKVFEKVKEFNETNMKDLPKEVVSLCNELEFIPFRDIIQILKGEYPFMKYYNMEVKA